MTKHGETNHFTASQHVEVLHNYLGRECIDLVMVNNGQPSADRLEEYEAERSFPVKYDVESILAQSVEEVLEADIMSRTTLIRHDPMRISWELIKVIQNRQQKSHS